MTRTAIPSLIWPPIGPRENGLRRRVHALVDHTNSGERLRESDMRKFFEEANPRLLGRLLQVVAVVNSR